MTKKKSPRPGLQTSRGVQQKNQQFQNTSIIGIDQALSYHPYQHNGAIGTLTTTMLEGYRDIDRCIRTLCYLQGICLTCDRQKNQFLVAHRSYWKILSTTLGIEFMGRANL